MKRLLLGLGATVLALTVAMPLGTYLMNKTIAEFFGPSAPQPSVISWGMVWLTILLIRNLEMDIDIDRLRSWIGGYEQHDPLKEIKDLRAELRRSLYYTEGVVDGSDINGGASGEREVDLG